MEEPTVAEGKSPVETRTEPIVLYEVSEQIATITINDPEHLNAMSQAVREGLRENFERFADDTEARVAILTGAGDKAFCAGAHLKEMAATKLGPIPRDLVPMPSRNIFIDKPLIAAVNGYAYGGGFLYVMLADIAIASETAKFAVPEVRLSRGAPWSVPMLHQIPRKVWFELVVTGEPIDAERAYEIGFVNAVVPLSDLMETARETARKIVRAAPLTVDASMKMIRAAEEMGRTAAWDVADEYFVKVYASEDALEGPRAWVEKREPRWQGK